MTWNLKAVYPLGYLLSKPKMAVGELINIDYYQGIAGDIDNNNFDFKKKGNGRKELV